MALSQLSEGLSVKHRTGAPVSQKERMWYGVQGPNGIGLPL